jgi:hypothetical protein
MALVLPGNMMHCVPGKSKLRDLHAELNIAVWTTYGFNRGEELIICWTYREAQPLSTAVE